MEETARCVHFRLENKLKKYSSTVIPAEKGYFSSERHTHILLMFELDVREVFFSSICVSIKTVNYKCVSSDVPGPLVQLGLLFYSEVAHSSVHWFLEVSLSTLPSRQTSNGSLERKWHW